MSDEHLVEYGLTQEKHTALSNVFNPFVARVETLIETESLRCPYREAIARSSNNRERLENVEKKTETLQSVITDIRLKVASWAGFAGIAAVVASELIKAVVN